MQEELDQGVMYMICLTFTEQQLYAEKDEIELACRVEFFYFAEYTGKTTM